MVGANSGHPLIEPWMWPPFLDATDQITAILEQAQPLRLSRKRDAFRALRSFDALLQQRAELVAGALLARASIEFSFAADNPDLVLGHGRYGIEVGTRAIDSPWAIHDQLELRLAGRAGLHVALRFDQQPLKIPEAEVSRVVDAVADHEYARPTTTLRFDGAGLTVLVTKDVSENPSRVVVEFQSQSNYELRGHMDEVEREIDNKMAEKRRQAQKMPTVLLIDVSRVGWAWLRPGSVWTSVLHEKLKGQPYVGLAIMVSTLDSWLPLNSHGVSADDAPEGLEAVYDRLAKVYELAAISE
jgi:hypothetical protein